MESTGVFVHCCLMKDRSALQNGGVTSTQAGFARSESPFTDERCHWQSGVGDSDAWKNNSRRAKTGAEVTFQKLVTINQPRSKIYAFWRNLENLPSFMNHLESVTVRDEQASYWVLRSSENHLWAWDVEITEDRQNEIISWRSSEDADIQTAGSVQFSATPDNQGTVVNLTLKYSPSTDKFRAAMGKVFEQDMRMKLFWNRKASPS
jgi:uncharacterized membrane protein